MQKTSLLKLATRRFFSHLFLLVSFLLGIANHGYSQQMSCGNDHSMALKSDGSIVCWGRNTSNELSVPPPNYGFVGLWTLNTDDNLYSVGLKTNGSLLFWGNIVPGSIPPPNSGFVSIATGLLHAVALKSDGSIVCWGYNSSGQCNVPSPNSGFVAVAAGKYFSMGLRIDGTLAIWGSRITSSMPVPNTGFVAISACDDVLLALKSDGSIVSWGDISSAPTPNSGFVAISAGSMHATALQSDGSVVCWGNNSFGQCDVPLPNSDFIAITAGYAHSMGLKSDGSIVCWGLNSSGECDVPSPNTGFSRVPAAPMLLPAGSFTSSSFTVHWYPTFKATGYQLDVSTYADFSIIDILNGQSPTSGTTTSYTVTGLTPGIPYYCRIRAVNQYGAGANAPFSVILKNDQVINFDAFPSKTYGDAPFTASAAGGASGNPVVFTSSDNTVATCTGTNGENITILKPGTCTIYASQAENGTYYAAQESQTLTVNPKTLTVDVTIPANKVYDGNTSFALTNATIGGILNSEDVSLIPGSLSFADRNAGNNKPLTATGFALSGTNAGNYLITQPTGLTADINKAPLSISLSAQNKTYDGTTDATVTSSFTGGYITGDDVTANITNGQFANKNAGNNKPVNANIIISGTDLGNYSLNTIATPTANITKATLVVGITAQNKLYDGTTTAIATASVNSGLIGGDNVTASATNCQFDNANTGNGKTVTADISLGGADAGNYFCNATATTTANITLFGVSPSNNNVTASAGSVDFSVTSGIAWSASCDQTWCTVTLSGSGNGTITATYTANTDASPRTATITISGAGVSDQTVTLTQAAFVPALDVSPASRNIKVSAGTTDFTVTSNIAWSASCDQTWCTVTPSGTGNGTITVTYSENSSTSSRPATITVSGTGVSNQTITVVQLGTSPALTVTPSDINVNSTSGSIDFAVTSNIAWTATSNQPWCSVTPSGTGNGTITVTYTENTGTNERIATIMVSGTGISNQTITVTQVAKQVLNIAISAQDKIYDGTTSVIVTAGITGGLTPGDDVTVTTSNARFDTGNVGTEKTVTANISIGGANAGNYIINTTATSTANITPATLTIGIAAQNKIYDGSTTATATAAITNGLITGDAVLANVTNSSFDTKNTGTGKTVTADVFINGASAGNYTCNSTANTTASITKANLIANITASPDLDYFKGGEVVTFTVTYQSAIDVAEGAPVLKFNGTGINFNADLNTSDRIAWTYQWTAPATGNSIVNLETALKDEAGNFNQYATGQTFFILDNPNGIEAIAGNKLTVYPTVNQGRFSISMSNSGTGKVTVKIFNTAGLTVKKIQFNKSSHNETFPVDMDSAAAGIYVVEISMNGYRELRRMVVE